jgi:hypothetical protein
MAAPLLLPGDDSISPSPLMAVWERLRHHSLTSCGGSGNNTLHHPLGSGSSGGGTRSGGGALCFRAPPLAVPSSPKLLHQLLPRRRHAPPPRSSTGGSAPSSPISSGYRGGRICNTPGVCHQLSNGFELKHDRLSGDDDVKVNLWR